VEDNISVSNNDKLGTKVEVKNLNSFRSMELAIEYEISRQSEILSENGSVAQETRGWDENKSKTYVQRSKESAMDYRYFPDPDIPKFKLGELPAFGSDELIAALPMLPNEIRFNLAQIGLNEGQIETLVYDKGALDFFLKTFPLKEGKEEKELACLAANYLLSDIGGLRANDPTLSFDKADVVNFKRLMAMVSENRINSRVAKDLLKEAVFEGQDPEKMATDKGLLQNNSSDFVSGIVEAVMKENEAAVNEVKSGKESALQYLVGQGMKASKGSADPKTLMNSFREKILG
jgi:aspartyl-tRNA(Asn)/glutamyl-tRNA(Gln) amidotransferase subunit B